MQGFDNRGHTADNDIRISPQIKVFYNILYKMSSQWWGFKPSYVKQAHKRVVNTNDKGHSDLPVTVAMLEPIAKDWDVAPAASDALINSWRYSRASAYSLRTNTHRMVISLPHHQHVMTISKTYENLLYFSKSVMLSLFLMLFSLMVSIHT